MLLGISGRKSAGKNSVANWITGIWMQQYDFIDYSYVNELGHLIVPMNIDGRIVDKALDFTRETLWLRDQVYPYIKQYAFADPLKQFCINHLGLTYEQCFGTDEQKNSLTKVRWVDWPKECLKNIRGDREEFMPARKVLEVLGTRIVRKLNPNAWSDGLLKIINQENPELAIITDVRFPNEVQAIQNAGGKVVRLTRNPYNSDSDAEVALDGYTGFDEVIDNAKMTMGEQNKAMYEILVNFGFITFEVEPDANNIS